MFVEGEKYNLTKKSKTKRSDRRERGRKRTWIGEGRLCRGNDTTTDRDSYVVTGHRVKNSQHKVTKKIYCHSTFHVLFFYLVAPIREREKERKERQQEEQRIGNEITV